MMKTKKLVLFAVFTALMLTVTACQQSAGIGSSPVAVSGVTLNKEDLTLAVGGTETLIASVRPDNAANKAVTWGSDDEDVATVDGNGKVTAVAAGTALITVTTADGGHTATSDVTVTIVQLVAVAVTGVTLSEEALTLAEGDTETLIATVQPENAANKAVTWDSDDEDVATVDENGEVTAVAAGTAVITVTTEDGGHTAASAIKVTPVPDSIEVTKGPNKTKYHIDEGLDIDGLEVTLTYSDNTTEIVNVTTGHITGFDSSTPGEKTLTVSYGGKKANFTVTVIAPVSIAISNEPHKTRYIANEHLDIDGLEVTLTYSDNTTEIVHVTAEHITGFDSSTGGVKTITVNYGGKIATFTITVVVPASIAISNEPDKTKYYVNEHLDIGGLEVTLTYSDNTTEIVHVTAEHITGFDSSTGGVKTVTVNYGGKIATFDVTVIAPASIIITRDPNKTTYGINEPLDITGLEVTAYSSGLTETVTITTAHITGFNSATTGVKTLTVSFGGQTATFDIIVAVGNNIFTVRSTAEWNAAKTAISGGVNNQSYGIFVIGDVAVAGSATNSGGSSFGAVSGISVTLQGNGKLYLNSTGSIINLSAGQTLIIDSANLTLEGLKNGQNGASSNNNTAAVYVSGGGAKLELRKGTITGNSSSSSYYGGGVDVRGGASFAMSGGAISNNTVSVASGTGGGVHITDNGSAFTMSGGTISGNSATYGGGGVYVMDGTPSFTMSGGTISGNTVTGADNNASGGGGVYVNGINAAFTISGGTISNNTVSAASNGNGGGVFVYNGNFTVSGTAQISNNTVTATTNGNGGGVYMYGNNAAFTISGGTISGNNASANGGGVYKYAGTFTAGGTAQISGNGIGGNVYLANNQYITPGSGGNAPANGMNVLVRTATANGVIVQSGATAEHVPYFHADQGGKAVILSDEQLKIVDIFGPIAALSWHEGSPISLIAPAVYLDAVTLQGWQISDTGSGGWTNFTPSTADLSQRGKYLRYYATSGGQTYYSDTVIIWVISQTARELTIAMFDYGSSGTGDGWDDNGALRIVVNGDELATGVKVSTTASQNNPSGQRNSNTYTFSVDTGDLVQLYWVAGTAQNENSFIVYYTDTPPNPTFTSSNNNNWSGTNALVYRLRTASSSTTGPNYLTNVAGGTLLGSFTVP